MVDAQTGLEVEGLSHLAVEVTDLDRARKFYRDVLGFGDAENAMSVESHEAVLSLAHGGFLVLGQRSDRHDLRATGVHQAYSVSTEARERIACRLGELGVEVQTYREDNPCETKDPFYFFDPDGNRVQLVLCRGMRDDVPALNHASIQVANLISAEWFYSQILGFDIAHRVGWHTADYLRAQAWADGKDHMAPGTRRLDKRYTVMVNRKVVARPNMQIFFSCGSAFVGVYLANQHFQEPDEFLYKGTPRIAFRVKPSVLVDACKRLSGEGIPFVGPIQHGKGAALASSLYFKDPGGNFLELATLA